MLYLHQIFNGIWMIERDYAANYLPIVAAFLSGSSRTSHPSGQDQESGINFAIRQNEKYFISEKGYATSPEEAPENSVAVIDITGAITKHGQSCGPAGMLTKANLLERCYASDNIRGIIIRTESGGGEAYAMRHFNETIINKNKPVVAFVDDIACSAAYGNISGCDMIVANSKLARIGSIGTYQTIIDHTEYFKKQGIDIKEIYASASTDKNADFYEAIKGNVEPLRKTIDVFNEAFLTQIETNRGDKLQGDRKVWGTGKVFFAEEALKHGLIDDIDTFDNVLNYFNT